ncbi:MAG TPA: hypothetical protein VGN34_03890 [Ktedonobacteraceae bacterium]|jgi:hypothetical protein
MPSITSLRFDVTDWQSVRQTTQQIIWKHKKAGDLLSIEFFAHPTELPFDMDDLEAIKVYHQEYSAKPNEGVIVSVDLLSFHGLDAVRMILKAHNPQIAGLSPLGMTYQGIALFPFTSCLVLTSIAYRIYSI